MRIAVLTCVLGDIDKITEPVKQVFKNKTISYDFIPITDKEFPPITGLTPRFQYRIPKYFGWQMYSGYDYYMWLDGTMSFTEPEQLSYFSNRCLDKDIVVFNHPWRHSIEEEANHVEEYLQKENDYITKRYKNGLHMEQLKDIQYDTDYEDDHLYASTAFMYKDTEQVRDALRMCWLHQSRYWTVDQLAFTYALKDLNVYELDEDIFKSENITLVGKHK